MATQTVTSLTKLYSKGNDEVPAAVSRAFFEAASQRKNDVQETSVDQFVAMGKCDRLGAVALMKALEGLGLGKLIIGRSGHKTRIRWDYSIASVGKVASGKDKDLKSISPDAEPSQEPGTIPRPGSKASLAASGPGRLASIPETLTIPDAQRLLGEAMKVHPSKVRITIEA